MQIIRQSLVFVVWTLIWKVQNESQPDTLKNKLLCCIIMGNCEHTRERVELRYLFLYHLLVDMKLQGLDPH